MSRLAVPSGPEAEFDFVYMKMQCYIHLSVVLWNAVPQAIYGSYSN